MTWLPWIIIGIAVVVGGCFLIRWINGSGILRRRQKTIENNIAELDKEKEAADAEREDRRTDALDADPFD